jgi:hypothetical protein
VHGCKKRLYFIEGESFLMFPTAEHLACCLTVTFTRHVLPRKNLFEWAFARYLGEVNLEQGGSLSNSRFAPVHLDRDCRGIFTGRPQLPKKHVFVCSPRTAANHAAHFLPPRPISTAGLPRGLALIKLQKLCQIINRTAVAKPAILPTDSDQP